MPSVRGGERRARAPPARRCVASVDDEFDAIFVFYSSFRSALSQVPTIEQLLPFAPARGRRRPRADRARLRALEPSPQEIIGYLLPRLVEVPAHPHALLDRAGAGEQAAAMTAMDSATATPADDRAGSRCR